MEETMRPVFMSDLFVQKILKDGIHVIPGFVQDVDLLHKSVKEILETDNLYSASFGYDIGIGKALFLDERMPEELRTPIYNVFHNSLFLQIIEGFPQTYGKPNGTIHATYDIVGTKHAVNDLHFDVFPSLKFMIYLNDVTEKNGAFRYVPNSMETCKKIRTDYGKPIKFKDRIPTRNLPYTEKDTVAVEGPAGTLLMFCTEIAHQAGTVYEGHRYAIRSYNGLDYKLPFELRQPEELQNV